MNVIFKIKKNNKTSKDLNETKIFNKYPGHLLF